MVEYHKTSLEEERLEIECPGIKPDILAVISVDIFSSGPECGIVKPVKWKFE